MVPSNLLRSILPQFITTLHGIHARLAMKLISLFYGLFRCDGCQTSPITGPRYKFQIRDDFDCVIHRHFMIYLGVTVVRLHRSRGRGINARFAMTLIIVRNALGPGDPRCMHIDIHSTASQTQVTVNP